MKRAFAGLAVTVLSLLLAACATSSGSEAPPPATTTLGTDAYHIGVDDIVQVSVWRNPELGITVPVRPDGMISVPLVGDVAAGGRTRARSPRTSRSDWPPTCAIRRSPSS